jgi:outer membrane protein OmpA-like peptidoglycan-associated protein
MKLLSPKHFGSLALASFALVAGGLAAVSSTASATSSATLSVGSPLATINAQSQSTESGRSIAYGDGIYVTVGTGIPGPDSTSVSQYSTNGTAWNLGSTLPSEQWTAVTYGDGVFVAVSYGDVAAYGTYSPSTGLVWTLTTPPTSDQWDAVAYGNGTFVAVSVNGTDAAYSIDGGQTWIAESMPTGTTNWDAITYGDGEFVALSSYQTNDVAYSPNGINDWTIGSMPGAQEAWSSVTYANGEFVSVSFYNSYVAYSTNGETWNGGPNMPGEGGPDGYSWLGVSYEDGEFVAVSYYNSGVAYSPNGVSWTAEGLPEYSTWFGIAAGDSGLVATAGGSENVELINFEPQDSVNGNAFVATLDTPTDTAPSGTMTVTDSANGTCSSDTWADAGFDGSTGELFTSTCSISSAESASETATATYSGADYSAPTSNELDVYGSPTITSATISGAALVGQTLSASANDVTGYPAPTASYQWYDGSTVISGATSPTYRVASADLGDSIDVMITESNEIGANAATSTGTAPVRLSTSTTTTTTTTTTLPTTTTTTTTTSSAGVPPVRPATVNLGFPTGSVTFSAGERRALSEIARELVPGSRVTVTSTDKGNAAVARRRAEAVAAFLEAHAHVTVTIHWSRGSGSKVMVVTTKN